MNERNGHRVPLDVGDDPHGTAARTGAVDWQGAPIVTIHLSAEIAKALYGFDVRLSTLHRSTCARPRRR